MSTTALRARTRAKVGKFFEEIAVGDLLVDETLDAQRIFQPTWANKLEGIWDPDVLLPAIVSLREDGCYYTLDGQHSNAVAVRVEGPEFRRDCMVYEGLSKEQEAKLFLSANRDRKPVRPFDNFRVALTARDPLAMQVNSEVTARGLEISNGTSTNRVGAVQALLAIGAKRVGLVERVLTVAEGAWGRGEASWDNMMLRALAIVLDVNWAGVDDKRLVKSLQSAQVGQWKQAAIAAAPGGGGSVSRSTPLAMAICNKYNVRLKVENYIGIGS